MFDETSLSEREWALLADAPLAAGAAVALADEGGGMQEADAMLRGWREAARDHGGSPLIAALDARMNPEARAEAASAAAPVEPPSFDQICDEAVDLCMRAVDLVEMRAAAEADSYRAFVMQIAHRVAEASRSSGLFGLGERVSRAERSVLREVATALRYREEQG